jgi:hypothetical protein
MLPLLSLLLLAVAPFEPAPPRDEATPPTPQGIERPWDRPRPAGCDCRDCPTCQRLRRELTDTQAVVADLATKLAALTRRVDAMHAAQPRVARPKNVAIDEFGPGVRFIPGASYERGPDGRLYPVGQVPGHLRVTVPVIERQQ